MNWLKKFRYYVGSFFLLPVAALLWALRWYEAYKSDRNVNGDLK